MRVRTGVEGFDPIVGGGLPEGASVILQGPPGNEKDLFGQQFLAEGLKSGEAVVIVISSQSPDQYVESLAKLGVNVKEAIAGNRIKIVDWHSYKERNVAGVEELEHVIRCSVDLTNVGIALSRALGTLPPGVRRRAVLEVLSPALQVFEVDQVYAFAQSSKAKLARHEFTALFLLEKEMHSPATVSSVSQPFDGVIDIDRRREGDAIVRKIGVLSMKDTAPDERFHKFLTLAGRGLIIKPDAPSGAFATPPSDTVPVRTAKPTEAPPAVVAPPSDRAAMILRIAEERVRIDPKDTDALFAKASALATMGDLRGAIGALDALVEANDTYPGLWVLRAKLFARLGDKASARENRRKSEEIMRREDQKARSGDTVPCPLCEGPVPVDAHECPICGARFIEEVGLAEELDSLGNAAIQERVGEDLHVEPATGKPADRKPAKPVDRVVEPRVPASSEPIGRRGMTNGLAREALRGGMGRTNGLTNGLKGRTNGLTNGLKGRTNGLTNGLKGRTNGLTNGLRGRTNGLTNGLKGRTNGVGRTNGLTNGLQAAGRTNGLTNDLAALRRGMTNGLTNGNGFTNGLGAARFHRESAMARWKLYVIPLISGALLLLPLLGPANPAGPMYPITIDGSVGDWKPAAIAAQTSRMGLNPNVDIVRFGVADNVDYLAFFAEVNGTALRGGDSPPTMDTFRFFIDTDRDASTGYRVGGLGADRLVEVSGWHGTVNASSLSEWDANRIPSDWRGWIKAASVTAAVSGGRLEAQVDWLTLVSLKSPVFVAAYSQGYDGSTDVADYALNSAGPSLSVSETPVVAATIGGANVPLLRLDLSTFGQDAGLTSLTVTLTGSAPFNAVTNLRLVDTNGSLVDQRIPMARRVTFQIASRVISPGAPLQLVVLADTVSSSGATLGAIVAGPADVGAPGAAVSVRRLLSAQDVGYLGAPPLSPRIDGGFAEWTSPTPDPALDTSGPVDPNVDLTAFGTLPTANETFFFAQVAGRFLAGTWVPKANELTPVTSQSPPDQDRDGVPDVVDPLPYDFNNDGTPDSETSGDYDGDNITDYGQPGGTDMWLNTTIPATFPAPYRGRPVHLYIGPADEPWRSPDDILRVFVDSDNSTATGYAIGGVGADRLIEVSGSGGLVLSSGMFSFSGTYPGQWNWTRLSNLSYALGFDRLELGTASSVTPSGSRIYVEIGGALGTRDSTASQMRGTRGDARIMSGRAPSQSSFNAAPDALPKTMPWNTAATATRGTLLDGSSNVISTQYNQQRKVVRAGDVPIDSACDASNSDGCWYAVFSDQFNETGATATPKPPKVQNGASVLVADTSSLDVTITSVDPAKSFLTFGLAFDGSDSGDTQVSGKILDAMTLRFQRDLSSSGPSAPAITIEWYVAEFPSGVSVQRGTQTMTAASVNVAISAVNMAHSFPLVTYRKSGLAYGADDFLKAKITTATNLQLSLDSVSVFDGVAEWQVVEYTYASIQTGDIAFATTDATRTASVSTVDTTRTWLLFSYSSPDGTTANMGQKMVRGVVTNATALTFDRDQTGQTLALTWYLVTFTDDTRVQGGTASFSTATTQVDATISTVDTTRAIAVAGAYHHAGGRTPYNSDDNPGTGTATLDLTTATNLRITRGLTGGQTANIGWFVVEFGTVITGSRIAGTFPTDILSEDGVFVQYREAVPYADAAIAYRSNTGANTVSSPKTRLWDASSWGSEGEESTAGSPIRAVRMAWSPIVPSTRIFVTESDDGWLDAYVCSPMCTVTNNIGRVWSTAPGTPERRFDVAYENVSGDALLAYGVLSTDPAQDIAFKIFSLGSWGPEQYLDDTGHATDVQYTQIDLASKAGSDIIGMIGGDDTNDDANAWIWDGNAWGSYTEITPTMQSPNYRQVALAWESNSGSLLAVAALDTSNDIISKEYTTSWSGTSQFTCASGSGMTKHTFWLSLKANPLSTANDMVLGLVQENYDLNTCYWTGSAWANWNQHDADYDAVQTRAFDFAWEGSGSKGLLVWGTSRTTGGGQITYKTFTAPNNWGGQNNPAMGTGFDQWVQLRTNPFAGTVKILGTVLDSNRLLGAIKWDGSTFTVIGSSTFSGDTGVASYESFDLRYRPTIDGGLTVRYDFANVPTATVYTLRIKGYRQDEDVNVQVFAPPATWTTRITISATSNTLYTYALSATEYNSGAPSIRFVDAVPLERTASDLWVDAATIIPSYVWDRVVIMRSSDAVGSAWGSQIVLASGRSGDGALVLARDSAEPSIAMDSAGYLHVVWVSASAAGDGSTLNLVRYTKTTVAWPTESELASGLNWQSATSVDDTNPGYMPTVSTDWNNYPHIAWSQSKSITASEAAAIEYRSNTGTNTVNSPKSRTWDGTSWSAPEIEEATAGSPLRNVRMAYSPIAIDERIVVTVSDDGWIDAYVCTPTCTVTNNLGQVWSSAPASADYRFAIAYEQLSGRALLVYGVLSTDTTRDIAYREYTGSWGSEQYLDNTNNGTDLQYSVMELAPKAGSDQVGLMAGTTNSVVTAWIWSGTAFGSFAEVTATGFASYGRDKMAIAWETNSGHLLAATAAGPLGETIVYREFTTSWSSSSTYPCGTSGKNDEWLSLKPNPVPTTDEMILLIGQTSAAVSTCYWSGSGWSNFVTHDASSDGAFVRSEDFAWESTGSRGLLVWGTNAGQITYRTFTAPNTWGTITNVTMGTTSHYWVTLRTNPFPQPGRPKILGAVLELSDDLGAITWDGSALTVVGANSFTADTGSHTYENFDLEYRPRGGGGPVYYKNEANGTWRATVSWDAAYTGHSVDVSPKNDFVSLARYYNAGTNEIQYTVCKTLNASLCDASSEFTRWNGAAGVDSVASNVLSGGYPTLATTWDSNADLWVGYTTAAGAVYARFLDYPSGGWQGAEQIDSTGGTTYGRLSIGVDRNGNLLAMYVNIATPQLYYKQRLSGVWDSSRTAVDTSSEWPVVAVRAPNDATYGTLLGALYWKTTTTGTYFFRIPEFEAALVPILIMLLGGVVRTRRRRRTDSQRAN